MSVSSPTISGVTKRPSGIIIIAVLWVLTSLYVLYWGIDTILLDLSYNPNAPESLELSSYARAWLDWGVQVDLVLCICMVAISVLMVFAAYGIYTAISWSYKSALAIPALAAFVHGATAAFYASAPLELGFSNDLPLHSALTLINLVWLVGIWIYARRPLVKQYLVSSPLKPIHPISQPAPLASRAISPSVGDREEKIIKAIVSADSPLTWNEIQKATDLDQDSLNKALAKLFRAKAIQKIGETGDVRYKVAYDLYKGYQAQLRLDSNIERRTELLKWINQWKEARALNFSLEHEHFFLEGRHLDDFSKELISHAKSDVLIVNPFIQHCDLSDTLIDVKKNGVDVKVITRAPKDRYPDKLARKQEYHQKLKNEGISLIYKENVHAKLIVVDDAVAISSSMNFFPESSAGVSWEAGLISINPQVVDAILKSPFSRLA